jgi:hypothetical protein
MLRFRRLALGLGALVAATLAVAVPGAVADSYPVNGIVTLDSTHFRIHFQANYGDPAFLSSARANDVLGFAERAYTTYTNMGYAAPVDDGDGNGKIEIFVEAFSGEPKAHYSGYVEAGVPAGSGIIHMDVLRGVLADPSDPTKGVDAHAVAHEVFNLFQWKIYATADGWLQESTAEWAAFQVANTVTPTANQLGEADRSIDCLGSQCGYAQSIAGYNEFYDRNANTGWSFFQYLSEKYGNDIVKQIWAQQAVDGAVPATQPVNEVLTGKGSSLSDAFNGWIAARLNGGFKISGAAGVRPTPFATVKTGLVSGTIKTQVTAVGHLSARYIQLTPGDGTTNSSCFGATLALTVTIPAGVTSAPYVFLDAPNSSPQAMTVSGSTATATIPWSTCGSSAPAYVSLPNATSTTTVNGTEFLLDGTITVDASSRPTAPAPPPQVKLPGTVIAVPTTDVVPSIELFGPELIRLSSTATQLRLIVSSSGPGTLQASLGSLGLGVGTLRTGNNDLRFNLPSAALSSLRRSAASGNLLTLTPLSPQGATGTPVVRQVAIDPTFKPVSTPKTKPVAKPKPKSKKTKSRSGR